MLGLKPGHSICLIYVCSRLLRVLENFSQLRRKTYWWNQWSSASIKIAKFPTPQGHLWHASSRVYGQFPHSLRWDLQYSPALPSTSRSGVPRLEWRAKLLDLALSKFQEDLRYQRGARADNHKIWYRSPWLIEQLTTLVERCRKWEFNYCRMHILYTYLGLKLTSWSPSSGVAWETELREFREAVWSCNGGWLEDRHSACQICRKIYCHESDSAVTHLLTVLTTSASLFSSIISRSSCGDISKKPRNSDVFNLVISPFDFFLAQDALAQLLGSKLEDSDLHNHELSLPHSCRLAPGAYRRSMQAFHLGIWTSCVCWTIEYWNSRDRTPCMAHNSISSTWITHRHGSHARRRRTRFAGRGLSILAIFQM